MVANTSSSEREAGAGSDGIVSADERSVAMLATPGDGSCGIGTYARDLIAAMDRLRTMVPTKLDVDQDDRSTRQFVSLAVRAISAETDVVHVQHEYGLFRRTGSRYPGVMSAVFFPVLFALAALRSTAVVVTLHSVLRPSPEDAPFGVRLYLVLLHKFLATFTDHLVFLSTECAQRFREDIDLDDGEYSVLPHGVNIARAVDVSRASAKRQFGFDPDDTVVMIPGFVRPPKGHDIFVDVARRLPEYEFFVAGGARPKGEDFEFAQQVAEDAPENVTISGTLSDEQFRTALASADLAVLPYREVSQSGTFNWCAAQQLAVLASDEPYFVRMEREWDNLETVGLEDPDGIASRVQDLIESPQRRRELRENMCQYRNARSFRTVAAFHRGIYERVCPDGELAGTTDTDVGDRARPTRGTTPGDRLSNST